MKFIIEHLEPELYDWCILEYKHIAEIADVLFTNVQLDFAESTKKSVKDMELVKPCVLDPSAEKVLEPGFETIILGGILGDEHMQGRTTKDLPLPGIPRRNLGKEQMSTDTAVYVAKQLLEGKKLSDIEFQDDIEIEIDEGESMILPFRYVLIDGKPMLPDGLVEHLRKGF